jgi:hypothetical protein
MYLVPASAAHNRGGEVLGDTPHGFSRLSEVKKERNITER